MIWIFVMMLILGSAFTFLGLSGSVGNILHPPDIKKRKKGEYERMETKNVERETVTKLILAVVVLCVLGAIPAVYDMVGPNYEFNNYVHGHMENAYYADEPHLMKQELESAIDGMRELNLEPHMYGAFWYWDKTPEVSMKYQYEHIEGIVERVEAVIVWYDANYGENVSGGTESLGDVYETKMDNLRGFLKEEGWSDWIAKDTFYINHHLWLYLRGVWLAPIVLLGVIYIVILIIGCWRANGEKAFLGGKWRWNTYDNRRKYKE